MVLEFRCIWVGLNLLFFEVIKFEEVNFLKEDKEDVFIF